jgi:RHS repeat-associated protein
MVAKTPGSSSDYSYTLQTTSWDSADFSQPSFFSSPVSGSLQGGADANSGGGVVYQYCIPGPSNPDPNCQTSDNDYDPVGNILGYVDSVIGTWGFSYDSLNRLTGASGLPPNQPAANYCWAYDSFGNRTLSVNVPCSQNTAPSQSYNANNQMTGGLVQYDPAGDVTVDVTGGKNYLYDGEGRICAVQFTVSGMTVMTGYIYNAEGQRVSKGSITQWSCDPSTNGFNAGTDYYIGPDGSQLTEIAPDGKGNMVAQRTYVSAGGQLMATLDPDGTHFRLTDWVGNLRATTYSDGRVQGTWLNLPFGEDLGGSGPTDPHHFTGKERDTESGNDYFGARYYASSMGRWLSPDWSAKVMPVPYAKLADPQTLNLYAYVSHPPYSTDPNIDKPILPDFPGPQ